MLYYNCPIQMVQFESVNTQFVCVVWNYPFFIQSCCNKYNNNKNICIMWTLFKCILISYCLIRTLLVVVIEGNFNLKIHSTFITQKLTLSCEFVSHARKKMLYDKHNFQMVGSGLVSHIPPGTLIGHTAPNNLHSWGSSWPPLSLSRGSHKLTRGNF